VGRWPLDGHLQGASSAFPRTRGEAHAGSGRVPDEAEENEPITAVPLAPTEEFALRLAMANGHAMAETALIAVARYLVENESPST
jgi:hypothetical protein